MENSELNILVELTGTCWHLIYWTIWCPTVVCANSRATGLLLHKTHLLLSKVNAELHLELCAKKNQKPVLVSSFGHLISQFKGCFKAARLLPPFVRECPIWNLGQCQTSFTMIIFAHNRVNLLCWNECLKSQSHSLSQNIDAILNNL